MVWIQIAPLVGVGGCLVFLGSAAECSYRSTPYIWRGLVHAHHSCLLQALATN